MAHLLRVVKGPLVVPPPAEAQDMAPTGGPGGSPHAIRRRRQRDRVALVVTFAPVATRVPERDDLRAGGLVAPHEGGVEGDGRGRGGAVDADGDGADDRAPPELRHDGQHAARHPWHVPLHACGRRWGSARRHAQLRAVVEGCVHVR